jgi:lipopolysaccharide export LptBFGC system permease protein LptF
VARALIKPGFAIGGVIVLIIGLGLFSQAILGSAVVPEPRLLAKMLGATGMMGLFLGVMLGGVLGVLAGLRRLQEEGAWLGVMSLGVQGRQLVFPVFLYLSLGAAVSLYLAHFGDPAARAWLKESQVEAAVRLEPRPGQTLKLGPWSAAIETKDGPLFFAGQGIFGKAEQWAIFPAEAGVVVELQQGELWADDRTQGAAFEKLRVPVPLPGTRGKSHITELATPALVERIAFSTSLGRDGYERWILYKRSLIPLSMLGLGLAGIPIALQGKKPIPMIAGAILISFWGGMRVLDGLVGAGSLLPWQAGILLEALVGGWFYSWLFWRER